VFTAGGRVEGLVEGLFEDGAGVDAEADVVADGGPDDDGVATTAAVDVGTETAADAGPPGFEDEHATEVSRTTVHPAKTAIPRRGAVGMPPSI
jgi:hypothetical protein